MKLITDEGKELELFQTKKEVSEQLLGIIITTETYKASDCRDSYTIEVEKIKDLDISY